MKDWNWKLIFVIWLKIRVAQCVVTLISFIGLNIMLWSFNSSYRSPSYLKSPPHLCALFLGEIVTYFFGGVFIAAQTLVRKVAHSVFLALLAVGVNLILISLTPNPAGLTWYLIIRLGIAFFTVVGAWWQVKARWVKPKAPFASKKVPIASPFGD